MTQAKIVEKIRKLGYKVTVLNASARNRGGIPDTLISINGVAVFLERKIDDDGLSKLQEHFRDEFYQAWVCLHYFSGTNEYVLSMKSGSGSLHTFIKELSSKLHAL